ncbi:DUF2515 family protein [Peribacillus sp. B-H-3]|uniref:DUF2515 family protein n=1 Tax=Peribacillus sp. B-H-3 TaxID=3400420 RepID=UPI003B018D47
MNGRSLPPDLLDDEMKILYRIKERTEKGNSDNISRTKAYSTFFSVHPEIKWAFLASMVSRNAGWNICDLQGYWMPRILSPEYRHSLFMAYEEANWLIFRDAFPQLLLYHYSTKLRVPLFHLSRYFCISRFMEEEWFRYWRERDGTRLMYSQIINEQNLIEEPVIKNKNFKIPVFRSLLFNIQDHFHYSTVLFPTVNGELYGASVSNFRRADARIELGKRLASILFSKDLFQDFYLFSLKTEPTGSRYDYERFFPYYKLRETPFLRLAYPLISHKNRSIGQWDQKRKIKKSWFSPPSITEEVLLTSWYKEKQKQLQAAMAFGNFLL